jgi:purine-binding chemotaxis protein CheW
VTPDPVSELRRLEAELRALRARIEPTGASETWQKVSWRFAFRAGRDRFALRLEQVREVLPMCWLAPYPEAPSWMSGLLNWHGRLIPVLDVAARIERRASEVRVEDGIVVVQDDDATLGLVVDRAIGVEPVEEELQRVPVELPQTPYVLGLFEVDGEATFALSLRTLVATSELPEVSA